MSSTYLFMFAAIFAVVSILIVFKIFIEKIKENPEDKMKSQTNFFIGVAISETLPILFIVLAFLNNQPVSDISQLYLPGLVVLLTLAFAPFFIFLQTKVDVTDETRNLVNQSAFIGIALATSIPIISLVGLLTSMP